MDQLYGCLFITVCCMVLDVLALDWLDDPGQGQFDKHEQRVPGRRGHPGVGGVPTDGQGHPRAGWGGWMCWLWIG